MQPKIFKTKLVSTCIMPTVRPATLDPSEPNVVVALSWKVSLGTYFMSMAFSNITNIYQPYLLQQIQ